MARFEHFESIPTRSQSWDSAYQHEVGKLSAMADGLNPLTISHTAKTISCTAIGSANMISPPEIEKGSPSNRVSNTADNNNTVAISPQTDSHRGMSFD